MQTTSDTTTVQKTKTPRTQQLCPGTELHNFAVQRRQGNADGDVAPLCAVGWPLSSGKRLGEAAAARPRMATAYRGRRFNDLMMSSM
mmetsp:Transcript_4011/g.11216  ORF Transcript_4011/g.11216 Transcript_4011/m.11216 type:complete len:87 (-) Transcript_4011:2202-2462(-)